MSILGIVTIKKNRFRVSLKAQLLEYSWKSIRTYFPTFKFFILFKILYFSYVGLATIEYYNILVIIQHTLFSLHDKFSIICKDYLKILLLSKYFLLYTILIINIYIYIFIYYDMNLYTVIYLIL
jgi:hypothetical protein